MTRRLCLAVCALQGVLFLTLLGIMFLNRSGVISPDTAESNFSVVAISFVVLSPFGLQSLWFTYSLKTFVRWNLLTAKQKELLRVGALTPFIVWKEVRVELGWSE